MSQKRRKVYLAFALIPAAALLLPMVAANPARAARTSTGQSLTAELQCANGASAVSGTTVTIPTTSGAAYGISANPPNAGQNANLTISDTTVINKSQAPGAAVFTSAGHNIGIGSVNPVGGTGDLTLTMSGANYVETYRGTGILVNNRGTGNSTASISGDLTVKSDWNKTIEGQDGVEVTTNAGNATLDMPNAKGTITVEGGGNGILLRSWTRASGADTYFGGSVLGNIGPGVQIVVNEPPGACVGSDCGSNGIDAYVDAGAGVVNLATAAGIATTGSQANGILAYAVNENVTVHNGYATTGYATYTLIPNSGAITTNGNYSLGIDAYTTAPGDANPAGNVSVINSGKIVSGAGSPGGGNDYGGGIKAYSEATAGAAPTGTVSVTNTGDITSYGAASKGILAYTQTTGAGMGAASDATVENSGNIIVDGATNYGIEAYTRQTTGAGAGNVRVANSGDIESGTTAQLDLYSGGIYAHSETTDGNTGAVTIINSANQILHTSIYGDDSIAIQALAKATGSGNAGDVSVTETSEEISTHGRIATSISAQSTANSGDAGKVTVNNSNDTITTNGAQAFGIYAKSASISGDAGDVSVTSAGGMIKTTGAQAFGIYAESASDSGAAGKVTVDNSSGITTAGSAASPGIFAKATGAGNVSVSSTGANITTTGAGAGNDGIAALAANGDAAIGFTGGTVQVAGQSSGLKAWATGAGAVSIDAASSVHAGWGPDAAAVMTGGAAQTITNNGTIDALSDKAVAGDAAGPTGILNITNNGTMTGSVTAQTSVTSLTNNGVWNLRNFADTTGSGVRDTLAVAVSDFGASGNNAVINNGTIDLAGGISPTALNTAGQYTPLVSSFAYTDAAIANHNNAMAAGGPAQGQILGVATFDNTGGVIDLTKNPVAGDALVISGGHNPGEDGHGVFVTGGELKLDTALNAGGAAAKSDILVVDSTVLGATGPTQVVIAPSGGSGAYTPYDGIPVVEVLNKAASADGAFKLSGRVENGIYEYDLYHNGVNGADGNWYLRAIYTEPDTATDADSKTPTLPSDHKPSPLPETALYTRNMAAASGMFIHTLHDRLGEPRYTEAYGGKNQTYGDKSKGQDNNAPAVWARVVGSRTDTEASGGAIDTKTDTGLVHIGGDIARWTDGNSRYHLGVMGAYGKSDTDAESKDVPYTNNGLRREASGDVEGYSVGVYGTWYGNDKYPQGPYVDVWGMFNWFDNTVKGNALPSESYNSKGGILSAEGGWAFVARDDGKRQWMLEPQAQVAYVIYNEDAHKEVNGTVVGGDDGNGFIGRLGVRMYSRSTQGDNGIQPFVEANVWHYGTNNSLDFNGATISDGAPSTRYEFKAGVQAELAQNWQAYAHVGGQWGLDGYDRYEGMAGVKYVW